MEQLLHYVWQYRLYGNVTLKTTDGVELEVIDPGIHNNAAGPDFFNAKIKMQGVVWAGGIEIHDRASDWFVHHHERDKAYDTVILHVTGEDDAQVKRTNGEVIPQLVLTIPERVHKSIDWLLFRDTPISCLPFLRSNSSALTLWIDALLTERLERKTIDITERLKKAGGDWDEAFYVTVSRSFGFGVNSDAFEWLAKSLPLHYILKHRSSDAQVEALFFGQAGMLDETIGDDYYRLLQREYRFLSNKYQLKPLNESLFKALRMRPRCFPQLRIAQLAALFITHDRLFSEMLEEHDLTKMRSLLQVCPSEYWKSHYRFNQKSPEREKIMGTGALNILLINAAVPMLFAYGKIHGCPEYCERATEMLDKLPPESNYITHMFHECGIRIDSAGCTQALIQLKRCYCEQRRCLICRIGHQVLRHSSGQK